MFWMQRVTQHAERDVVSEQAIIDDLRQTLSAMKDAETGQRGYLLTGDERYLNANLEAKPEIEKDLDHLDACVRAGSLPAGPVKEYHDLVEAKLKELDETIGLRRTRGFDAAAAIVRNNSGERLMERMRLITEDLVGDCSSIMAGERRTVGNLSNGVVLLLGSVMLLNLGVLGWAYRRIQHEVNLRAAAAREAVRQRELFRTTLASIGDGVIVADDASRITFINEVAERLCGWEVGTAVGRRCEEVFKIINETSREVVESPVDKVLREGIVVGLANHTLLIRKDGTEIPIDDSGAPVRDGDGAVRGVVLVFRDFSEHKEAEEALRMAMEDAQAANVAKDNFLATLSHELRTPLTPVVMTLASWAEGGKPTESWREDVEMMQRNLELEARLIDDLLDLTRIVRGKLSLNPTVADVNELVDAVARMYQSEIFAKGLRLSLDLKAARHHAFVDPARLQQVFLNVLKNATKFTPGGGDIEIRTDNLGGEVRVSIRDTGVGMTGEMRSRLFQPFEQGTDEVVKRYGGLGLGMAISKALMEVQGGSISASSEGPGRGSTFNVGIPTVEPEQATRGQMLAAAMPDRARSYRILLVEDHVDTARALCRLLDRSGHEVTTAYSMAEAMEELEKGEFDLMLSDIGLPDGTGLELMRKVRAISNLPAVALTGFGMEEDVVSCREAGFDEHLTKPISFQKLELIIQQLMQERKSGVGEGVG
jgi:PAS domain S-box-containing protein